MSELSEFNQDELIRLLALQSAQAAEFEDDDDDESWESDDFDDDDESMYEMDDDDDDDEGFYGFDPDFGEFIDGEDDDDDDDEGMDGEFRRRRGRRFRGRRFRLKTGRRRYRRRRSRRLPKVKGSNRAMARSRTGQTVAIKFNQKFAKAADVNKLIKSTESKFKAALKERKTNYDRLAKQISDNSKALNNRVKSVAGKVQKLENSSQTSQLLPLLMGPPKIKTIKFKAAPVPGEAIEIEDVDYQSQDNLLPLVLAGGLGGGSGSDNNTLLLALMLNKKD